MYRSHHLLLPALLQSCFSKTKDIHDHNIHGENNFYVKNIRTSLREMSLLNRGIELLYKLPNELKLCNSVNHLKKKYKEKSIGSYITG